MIIIIKRTWCSDKNLKHYCTYYNYTVHDFLKSLLYKIEKLGHGSMKNTWPYIEFNKHYFNEKTKMVIFENICMTTYRFMVCRQYES